MRRVSILIMVLALVGSACSEASEEARPANVAAGTTTPETSVPSTSPETSIPAIPPTPLTLAEAAAALENEDTAVDGVIAILDELNIGIYRADGTVVVPGSEDDPDDLWLLAELLPGLATSARQPGPTWAELTSILPGVLEAGITSELLADAFRNMVEVLPEYPMSRVLAALDVDLSAGGELSRFEAWLLLVSLVPSNGSMTTASGLLVMASASAVSADVRCDEIGGDGSPSGFSLAMDFIKAAGGEAESVVVGELAEGALNSTAVTTVAKTVDALGKLLGKLNKLADIAKVAQIIVNTEARVYAFTDFVHEVHDTEGENGETNKVQLTADVTFGGVTAATEFHCRFAGMLGLPAAETPIEGAQVQLTLDEVLAGHGTFSWETPAFRVSTDAAGRAIGWYTPNDEPDAAQKLGEAFYREEQGAFTATIDVMTAMGQLLNLFAGIELAADILGVKDITVPLTVGWHDPAMHLSHVVPMTGFWTGNWALDLQTCDGVAWKGFVVTNATATVSGATLEMTGDSPIAFTTAPGQESVEVPVEVVTMFTTRVEDIDVSNEITQAGTLTLDLSRRGSDVRVDLNLEAGTQDILVQAPEASASGGGITDASSQTFNVPIQRPSCEG